MLEGLFMLLMLSTVMALASFLAGALPLSMTLSSSQLRLISTIGMGVLVGTSLIVIIPEGIEAIYFVGPRASVNIKRSLQMHGKGVEVRWAPSGVNAVMRRQGHFNQIRGDSETMTFTMPGPVIPEALVIKAEAATSSSSSSSSSLSSTAATETEPPTKPSDETPLIKEGEEHHEDDVPTFYIGLSLISGFILMFLIDKLPRHASENLQPPPPTRHISLDNLFQGLHFSPLSSEDQDSESFLQSLTPTPKQSRSLATTTGLVIHAAADGIALGASVSSSDAKLGFVIFVAIMIHKAPAAFGLTSVLLKQGLSKRAARGHLIIFSLAAPFGALSTWLLVHILGGGGIGVDKGQWWTGGDVVIFGGTFLYVAMHAMQEDSGHDHLTSNGYAEGGSSQRKQQKPRMRDTLAAVGGMLVPLLTQIGHGH